MVSLEMEPAASSNRYTPDGDAAVESRIDRDQQLIAAAVMDAVPASHFRALVLIGGYARGEGGFRHVDGNPEPYNDYDYFVVVRGMNHAAIQTLKASLLELGHLLTTRVGVEVDLADRSFAAQEDAVLCTDREPGADEPVVATEHMFVQRRVVLLGCGHHEGLEPQRALPEREPDGDEVLVVAGHTDEPPSVTVGRTVDGDNVVVFGVELTKPFVDLPFEDSELCVAECLVHNPALFMMRLSS